MTDDPFERAARREAMVSGLTPHGSGGRPLIGLLFAWGIFVALHWWVAGSGLAFRIHVSLFVVGAGFTVFAVIATSVSNQGRWGMFAIVAGWIPALGLHWAVVQDRNLLLTLHTAAFACTLAAAILAAFAVPSERS